MCCCCSATLAVTAPAALGRPAARAGTGRGRLASGQAIIYAVPPNAVPEPLVYPPLPASFAKTGLFAHAEHALQVFDCSHFHLPAARLCRDGERRSWQARLAHPCLASHSLMNVPSFYYFYSASCPFNSEFKCSANLINPPPFPSYPCSGEEDDRHWRGAGRVWSLQVCHHEMAVGGHHRQPGADWALSSSSSHLQSSPLLSQAPCT